MSTRKEERQVLHRVAAMLLVEAQRHDTNIVNLKDQIKVESDLAADCRYRAGILQLIAGDISEQEARR